MRMNYPREHVKFILNENKKKKTKNKIKFNSCNVNKNNNLTNHLTSLNKDKAIYTKPKRT